MIELKGTLLPIKNLTGTINIEPLNLDLVEKLQERVSTLQEDISNINNAFLEKGVEVGDAPSEEYGKLIDQVISVLFNEMFANLSTYENRFSKLNMKIMPYFDTSETTHFNYMFQQCTKLEEFPTYDTSNGTGFTQMCHGCTALKTIPPLNISNGEYFIMTFFSCPSITTTPLLDVRSGINFQQMFYSDVNLKTVTLKNTGNGQNFNRTFGNCLNVVSISTLNFNNATNLYNTFYCCYALENITFEGEIPISISFQWSSKLTIESLMNILNALKDLTGETAQTLTLGDTNIAKLTAEQLAIATNKNWIVK